MKNFLRSLLNLLNFKERIKHMSIAELKAFNLHEEKIEKQKIFRAYITEINQRYKKIRKKEKNSLGKLF
tara:strand:+ start:569 stop:775 length:207 start_codon:yes stop_codon:yes gene_type:complete